MALVTWNKDIETGFFDLDGDHREIISQLNLLHEAFTQQQQLEVELSQALMTLSDYVGRHFAREEDLMSRHAYAAREAHVDQHTIFRNHLEELLTQWDEKGTLEASQLIDFLTKWFVEHIKVQDMAFVAELPRPAGE